jgi:hypothetical protein
MLKLLMRFSLSAFGQPIAGGSPVRARELRPVSYLRSFRRYRQIFSLTSAAVSNGHVIRLIQSSKD